MTHFIRTIEEFRAFQKELTQPVYITSKKHGKIPVPCANTILVSRELIVANNYNPNRVEKSKMQLLKQSILDNGFAFPVLAIWDEAEEKFVLIDGFHRDSMGDPKWLDLDFIPLAILPHDISKRLVATVQFNKARGVHQVDLDADVIRSLVEQGMNDEEISIHLGIDLDTIARYKSLTGIAALFAKAEYSPAWEMSEEDVA